MKRGAAVVLHFSRVFEVPDAAGEENYLLDGDIAFVGRAGCRLS